MKRVYLTLFVLFVSMFNESFSTEHIIHGSYSKKKDDMEFISLGYQILETDTAKTMSHFFEFRMHKSLNSSEVDEILGCYAGLRLPIIDNSHFNTFFRHKVTLDIGAGMAFGDFFTDETIHSITAMLAFDMTFSEFAGVRLGVIAFSDFEYTGEKALPIIGLFYRF